MRCIAPIAFLYLLLTLLVARGLTTTTAPSTSATTLLGAASSRIRRLRRGPKLPLKRYLGTGLPLVLRKSESKSMSSDYYILYTAEHTGYSSGQYKVSTGVSMLIRQPDKKHPSVATIVITERETAKRLAGVENAVLVPVPQESASKLYIDGKGTGRIWLGDTTVQEGNYAMKESSSLSSSRVKTRLAVQATLGDETFTIAEGKQDGDIHVLHTPGTATTVMTLVSVDDLTLLVTYAGICTKSRYFFVALLVAIMQLVRAQRSGDIEDETREFNAKFVKEYGFKPASLLRS